MSQSPQRACTPWSVRLAIVLTAWLTCHGGSALAADLKCGSSRVATGDFEIDVIDLCGEPLAIAERVRWTREGYLLVQQEWLYRLGRNQFQRVVVVENGRVVDVELGRKPRR